MRLLIATPLYPPEPGGPATYAKLLNEGLPKLGIDVTLVKFSDVRYLPKVISHIAYALKVFRLGRTADLILSLDALSVGWPALFANLFIRKKFVVKMVGDHIWEQGQQRFGTKGALGDNRLFTWHPYLSFLRLLQQVTLRAADRVIVPSEYLKGIVSSWGIRSAKVEVIYNAITLGAAGALPEVVVAAPHPKAAFIGRLVPWKHVDGIIEAIAMVSGLTLIVVGDGPESERLRTLAKEKGGDNVIFTGALSNAESLAVMRDADMLVLNSSYEGLSHVLIEGLVSGLPIVATDAGGNSEVLSEGSGILIPVGDTNALREALEKLVQNPELRARLGAAAQKRAKAFSVPVMLSRTKDLLTTI